MKKYYTFLYIPDSNSEPKTFKVSRLLVSLMVSAILILSIVTGSMLIKYSSKIKETYKLATLEKENQILHKNLKQIQEEMNKLRNQITRNFDFQKRARLLANLDELNEDVSSAGVGGPEFAYVRSLSILDDASKADIESIRKEINKLLRQAELQRKSYEEIVNSLSEERKLLNATPSIRPVMHGFISSRYGRRMDPFTGKLSRHQGVDFSVPMGAPIYATADGVVTYARRWSNFGNVVEISHGFGFVTRYAHVSKIFVRKGQRVRRGDIIARVGSTGKSTAAHLHYEVLCNGVHRNPLAYILSNKEIVN